MDFYNIFISIFTLFVVGLAGFFGRRRNIITKEMADNIPKFITHITLPALFVVAMQLPFTWNRISNLGYLAITAVVAYAIQFLMAFLIPFLLKERHSRDKGVYQFMMIFSNAAFMGFPVLLSVFGQEAIFYGAIFNIPFNALVFTLGVYLMEKGKTTFNARKFLSPPLIATFLGFLLFLLSVEVPGWLSKPLTMVGEMTTPLSMIFIGASLSAVNLPKIFVNKKLYVVTLFRLLVIPLGLFMILRPFIDDTMILGIPVIIMAMPVAALCAILAKAYDSNVELAAEGIFMSTSLSMVTIPFVVWIMSIM
ncbi:AEC family transporter [Alkalibacter rhizosphaerae]|uniref:AEC family transporter n=1 Tax=Alkalibacter rhizosphaerae TaxID=2815577 RepID=A0A975AGN3_9FIRM|nr:AEC family transporter [Alkalibacter rhizosphaerae]QSX07729.1 AEC family transporter [Alkalibacter rhizosphaerae]